MSKVRKATMARLVPSLVTAGLLALGFGLMMSFGLGRITAQAPADGVRIDQDDIAGIVTSSKGPEAGVWVIAQTKDLPTDVTKIVVTDDQGKYVLPDLPRAAYSIWVRGYGLKDSTPVQGRPGQHLNLTAVIAANGREAAQVYPANYWEALMNVPPKSDFPGTGPNGNGISERIKTQSDWVNVQKDGCHLCHQIGNRITREVPGVKSTATADDQSTTPNHLAETMAAWDRRIQSGQRGADMSGDMTTFGRQRGLQMFADWSDRIAKGEYPTEAPPRPQGVERNVVLTLSGWGTEKDYVHDEVATDKRNPTLNANGKVYGVAISNDLLTMYDPTSHEATNIRMPLRSPKAPMIPKEITVPSPYWGEEVIWDDPANPHNPMMDSKGRVWMTAGIRNGADQPAYCKDGSLNKFAKYFPIARGGGRQASFYDPKTQKFTLIDTCFGTHHLQFAHDANETLYFSGGGAAWGWINTKMYDQTGDEKASQGWCPIVIDYNGDGKITEFTNPGEKPDPKKDVRLVTGNYGVIINPKDGSVWGANTANVGGAEGAGFTGQTRGMPGRIVRLEVGSNPPETCRAEVYEVPFDVNPTSMEKSGFNPRGIDVDTNGVIWTALASSGHFASFDRSKCKGPLNGPTATGDHCREGWTLYPDPGPRLRNTNNMMSADWHYYNWVDQHDTLGLGKNVPIMAGSNSDSLQALDPATGKWTVMRVPYPMGYFTRGMDGRIDDPKAGWKGKGVWSTYGGAVAWHLEGGKGTKPKIIHFQIRPDPLAH